jgi:hypothetical protein
VMTKSFPAPVYLPKSTDLITHSKVERAGPIISHRKGRGLASESTALSST